MTLLICSEAFCISEYPSLLFAADIVKATHQRQMNWGRLEDKEVTRQSLNQINRCYYKSQCILFTEVNEVDSL